MTELALPKIDKATVSRKNLIVSDLKKFTKSGADAFLIGETLMRSNNIYEETQKIIKR